MDTKQKRNNAIDIFRYICAVMVVAIHNCPFAEINGTLAFICTEIIPRIAVPYFFAIAGYYYIPKLKTQKKVFLSYTKKLLAVYGFWSCIYYAVNYFTWGYMHIKGFAFDCVYSFFISGSYYHFWFFPALLIAVCITTVVFKLGMQKFLIPSSILLYILGCLGCSYYKLGSQIPIIGEIFQSGLFELIRRILLMGFPFFVSGYMVKKIEEKRKQVFATRYMLICWVPVCLVWLLEIVCVIWFGWQENIILTFGLYPLVISIVFS